MKPNKMSLLPKHAHLHFGKMCFGWGAKPVYDKY
jgi:hypothetical protein